MLKKLSKLTSFTLLAILFFGCSDKNYHNEMIDNTRNSFDKKDYQGIKESYSKSLVNEKSTNKEYISILDDKSLADVLKEMEVIDGNLYYLKSSDILIPKSRMKIHNINELNQYLNAVLDKELFIKKKWFNVFS